MILLINPPTNTVPDNTHDVPLGLAYIGGFLLKNGYHVSGLDLSRVSFTEAEKKLKAVLEKDKPGYIGITSVSSTYETARELLSLAKKILPETITIHGGVHVSLAIAEVIIDSLNNADILVFGEGEESILEIVKRGPHKKDILGIAGIAVLTNGGYSLGPTRTSFIDLNQLPPPERNLFYTNGTTVMRIMTSRGCPYNCCFCASSRLWQRKIRYLPISTVINDFKRLLLNFNCEKILIVDDTFTLNSDRAINILKAISEVNTKRVELSCLTRVDCLSNRLLEVMKSSNVKSISLGCESGNNDILRKLRKNVTTEQIRSSIRLARKNGIKTRTSWIWGLPFDSAESLQDTIKLIMEEQPDEVVIYRFVPYPGTEFYDSHPELKELPSSLFYSGSDNFLLPIDGMTIEEMNYVFDDAFSKLLNFGYVIPSEAQEGDKTATSSFTKFSSFWPKD